MQRTASTAAALFFVDAPAEIRDLDVVGVGVVVK